MGPSTLAFLLTPFVGRAKLKIAAAFVLLILLTFGALWFFGDVILVGLLRSRVREKAGAELGISRHDVRFFAGTATFDTITLDKPGELGASIPRLRIISGPWRHLAGSSELEHVTIERPVLRRTRTEDPGKPSTGPPDATKKRSKASFRIADLTIVDGDVEVTDPSKRESMRTIGIRHLRVDHAEFDNQDEMSLLRTAERIEGELHVGAMRGRVFIGTRDGVRTWAFENVDLAALTAYWPGISKLPFSAGIADVTCAFNPHGSSMRVKLTAARIDGKGVTGLLANLAAQATGLLDKSLELSFPIDYDPQKLHGPIGPALRELWAAMGRGVAIELGRRLGGRFSGLLESLK